MEWTASWLFPISSRVSVSGYKFATSVRCKYGKVTAILTERGSWILKIQHQEGAYYRTKSEKSMPPCKKCRAASRPDCPATCYIMLFRLFYDEQKWRSCYDHFFNVLPICSCRKLRGMATRPVRRIVLDSVKYVYYSLHTKWSYDGSWKCLPTATHYSLKQSLPTAWFLQ